MAKEIAIRATAGFDYQGQTIPKGAVVKVRAIDAVVLVHKKKAVIVSARSSTVAAPSSRPAAAIPPATSDQTASGFDPARPGADQTVRLETSDLTPADEPPATGRAARRYKRQDMRPES